MPAFPMPAEEAHAIVVFLRDARDKGADEVVTGDPQVGQATLFWQCAM